MAALFMAGTAHAEVTPTTLLPLDANTHAGDKLLWVNKDDVLFVSGSKLMRIRAGETPAHIANGVLSNLCPADDGKSVLFTHTSRKTAGRYMVDTANVDALHVTPDLEATMKNCARGGGRTQFYDAEDADAKMRLQSPHNVFDLTLTEGKPRVVVYDKHTLDAKPQVYDIDWTLGGKLTDTKSYTVEYNPTTRQTVLYPLLDFNEKRTIWKKNYTLPVLVYDHNRLKTYAVRWFAALEKTNYTILPNSNDMLVATSWYGKAAQRMGQSGLWQIRNGHANALYKGNVEHQSMAVNPNGRTLAFIEHSETEASGPVMSAIRTLELPR